MMGRQSLTERYEALQERGSALALNAKATPTSPVHARTLAVLTKLLTMGTKFSNEKVPLPLRTMMRTLQHLEPVLLEELSSVPPEAIQEFLGELIAEMQTICDVPTTTEEAHGNGNAPGAGDAGATLATSA